ncbi:hypothetical protein A2769_02725 [Candidatus Daviesbacteria bacterium RIFCSPHIGHO2_01_FULL_37_27]|nr:MAG: hypothetical protein A2769_02725 [Candidatus Daviesbacteria bacterium RIFCSPHIGHO2_01_FULL_37_27]
MGREAKINKKLTPKQTTFVKELVNGKSATQAVMSAYNVTSTKTASVIASQNLNKLSIQEALEKILRTKGLTLDTLAENIGNLANSTPQKVSGETILKANIELLRLHGAYPDKKSYQFNMSVKGKIKDLSYSEAQAELNQLESKMVEFEEDVVGGQ